MYDDTVYMSNALDLNNISEKDKIANGKNILWSLSSKPMIAGNAHPIIITRLSVDCS